MGQAAGIPQEISSYLKSQQINQCPDDHALSLAEVVKSGLNNGGQPAQDYIGMDYYDIMGTSYKFTNQNYTHATGPNAKLDTGYVYGPTGGTTCTTIANAVTGKNGCDFVATADTGGAYSGPLSARLWNAASGPVSFDYTNVTLSDFTRVSETRCVGDYVKTFIDSGGSNGGGRPMHPIGVVIGYVDGHAKYINSETYGYYVGCDGLDFAWDLTQGSCNSHGYQRSAD
jgi:hypothetical protein